MKVARCTGLRSLAMSVIMMGLCAGFATAGGAAVDALPAAVAERSAMPLAPTGSGAYHKLGFTIYNATLWAPGGTWHQGKPYALQLRYKRSLSRETLVSSVIDNIRAQGKTDEATLGKWEKNLNETLPSVRKNDELVGLSVPHKNTQFFLNGNLLATISDQAFSDAFFGIWLGNAADPALRTALLESGGK